METIENILIGRFPKGKDFLEGSKYHGCKVVINVSDEFYLGNAEELTERGIMNFYFPMGELGNSMGLRSIYGALQVLHQINKWNPEWMVLIHCQAGRNRSPLIKSAFHYMMKGEHEDIDDNRLIYNCNKKHLPELEKMELFLEKCKFSFDNPEKFFGGMLDWCLKESGLDK